jgi:hypothetical protein
MSDLRPTLVKSKEPGLSYTSTYFRVLQAVLSRRGLIHGRLEDGQGRTCAIGAYFRETNTPINSDAIDEIAAYNDSFPKLTSPQRRKKVLAWLRFCVRTLGRST